MLINDNDRIDTYIIETLQNGYVSSGIGLLNSHTLHQYNESSNFNDMNMIVDNGGVNVDYLYLNISTGSESKNHNSVDYSNKIDKMSTKSYLRENIGLPDSVCRKRIYFEEHLIIYSLFVLFCKIKLYSFLLLFTSSLARSALYRLGCL